MRDVDWPLAITLVIVFVVMSVFRWRYFRSRASRIARKRAEREPPAS